MAKRKDRFQAQQDSKAVQTLGRVAGAPGEIRMHGLTCQAPHPGSQTIGRVGVHPAQTRTTGLRRRSAGRRDACRLRVLRVVHRERQSWRRGRDRRSVAVQRMHKFVMRASRCREG